MHIRTYIHAQIAIHMGASLHIMFMHIDAKKSLNYLLTLNIYKTFLVLEKNIPPTIILRCLNYPEVTLTEN